jgi:hypothetical protein
MLKFLAGFIVGMAVGSCSHHANARNSFPPAPLPYSCYQVRQAVAYYRTMDLQKISDTMGIRLTASQMREAHRCLREV